MNAIEIDPQLIHYRPGRVTAGLDIGSRGAKGVLFTPDAVYAVQIPTGLYMQETADQILSKLLRAARIKRTAAAYIVGTGYGRISLAYSDVPYQVVTEISCHAMGAHVLNPATRTIIDIGGQDSKAIKVDAATGKVLEFVMNDKCAAGTGRFLEKAAVTLGLTLDQLGQVSLQAKEPAQVSSQCVVFAESEVISLRARGGKDENHEVRANIAAGIHYSAARRVKNLLGRVGLDPDLVFSGGVSNNPGMWAVLEELLGARFVNPKGIDMIYAGALGAAVYAAEYAKPKVTVIGAQQAHHKVDLSVIQKAIENEQSAFIENKEGRKQAAYFCAYTPPELLAAAGVRHARLFQGGDPVRVAAGELYTQSVACDFSKSCIGAFEQGDPFHKSFDKIYNFHTCAAMKRASEVVDQFVPVQMLNLPKRRADSDSRAFYRDELEVFRKDLEALTGHEIQPAAVQKQIVLHNKLRRLLKKLSDLRKRPTPVLSGTDYIDLVRAYYYLPPERALTLLEEAYRDLRDSAGTGGPRPEADALGFHHGRWRPQAAQSDRGRTRRARRGRGPLRRAEALLPHGARERRPAASAGGRLPGPGPLRAHEAARRQRRVLARTRRRVRRRRHRLRGAQILRLLRHSAKAVPRQLSGAGHPGPGPVGRLFAKRHRTVENPRRGVHRRSRGKEEQES